MRRLQVMFFIIMGYGIMTSRSAHGVNIEVPKNPLSTNDTSSGTKGDRYYEFTVELEEFFKKAVKMASKPLLKYMVTMWEDSLISRPCEKSLMKYLVNLMKAKLWAVQMLDASSKTPPGILSVTFADFGSFDECLDVNVYHGDGTLDFRGSSCAVEVLPPKSELDENSNLLDIPGTGNGEDTLGARFREAKILMQVKPAKFVVCVPSTCSLGDLRLVAERIMNETYLRIKVQKCYVKEETVLLPIHYVVLTCMGILLILGISGSLYEKRKKISNEKFSSSKDKILLSFSLSSNFKRFLSTSGGAAELRCIHGIKAVTILFVILGHSYGFMNFNTPKDAIRYQTWVIEKVTFQFLYNSWPAVETFFLISGILVTYAGLKAIEKTGGKLNVPFLILHRYLRLTPSVLLIMGLVFFLPLLSSGPFWFDKIDPTLQTCRTYWWTTILYFHNWWGIEKTCLLTTWYLAADFQLHILSLLLLIILFRYAKVTLGIIFILILISCSFIGLQTWFWNYPATAPFSEGNNQKVDEFVDRVHINTLTHLGPHCIGMLVGYYVYNCREKRISKPILILGWCAALTVVPLAMLGNYRFVNRKETSRAAIILYASVYRSIFTCGIAWMLLACITGNGGALNAFLSSSILAPVGRLTYMIYLVHPLVIWTKLGSMRERPVTTHYEFIYQFLANAVVSIVLATPFYLLLEAPLSNLERVLMHRSQENDADAKQQTNSAERNCITLNAVKSQ